MKRKLSCLAGLILAACLALGLQSYARKEKEASIKDFLPSDTEMIIRNAYDESGLEDLIEAGVAAGSGRNESAFTRDESPSPEAGEATGDTDAGSHPEESAAKALSQPEPDGESLGREEPESPPEQAVYSCGKLEIAVPGEYLSRLIIVENRDGRNGYQPVVSFYERASVEAAQKDFGSSDGWGFLFEFALVRREDYQNVMGDDIPGRNFFAEDVKQYYVYACPTDVRLYRSGGGTERDRDDWAELTGLGPKLRDDAFRRASVDPYSAPMAPAAPAMPAAPAGPSLDTCFLCGGTGFCYACHGSGACGSCHGMGRSTCIACVGLGHCTRCFDGYVYEGVGIMHRKVACTYCDGTGECKSCGSTGYISCAMCGGDGNCGTCSGIAFCPACSGSGRRF